MAVLQLYPYAYKIKRGNAYVALILSNTLGRIYYLKLRRYAKQILNSGVAYPFKLTLATNSGIGIIKLDTPVVRNDIEIQWFDIDFRTLGTLSLPEFLKCQIVRPSEYLVY